MQEKESLLKAKFEEDGWDALSMASNRGHESIVKVINNAIKKLHSPVAKKIAFFEAKNDQTSHPKKKHP